MSITTLRRAALLVSLLANLPACSSCAVNIGGQQQQTQTIEVRDVSTDVKPATNISGR